MPSAISLEDRVGDGDVDAWRISITPRLCEPAPATPPPLEAREEDDDSERPALVPQRLSALAMHAFDLSIDERQPNDVVTAPEATGAGACYPLEDVGAGFWVKPFGCRGADDECVFVAANGSTGLVPWPPRALRAPGDGSENVVRTSISVGFGSRWKTPSSSKMPSGTTTMLLKCSEFAQAIVKHM